MATEAIPVLGLPLPVSVNLTLVRVAELVPELAAVISRTVVTIPGRFVELAGLEEPTEIVTF